MYEGMELHGLPALGLEYVHLVVLCRDGFPRLLPSQNAAFQVDTLIAFGCQFPCRIGRAATTAAIDGNLLVLG